MGIWDDFSLEENGSSGSIWKDFSLQDLKDQKPVQEASALEKVFDVPSAAIRGAIQGKGYSQSAANFKDVPKFQDVLLDKYYQSNILKDSPAMKGYVGMVPSAVGLAADIATNPAEGLMSLAGGKGLEMMAKAGKSLGAPFKLRAIGNQAKEMEKVAQRATQGVAKAQEIINSKYTSQIGSAFNTRLNPSEFKQTSSLVLKAIDDAPDLGTNFPLFDKILNQAQHAETLNDLHRLKSAIGSASRVGSAAQRQALKKLYGGVSDILSGNKTVLPDGKSFGSVYSSITKEFENFTNKIGNVVSAVSQKKYGAGRPMPSGERLSGGVLKKPEVERAFKALEEYFPKRGPFSPSGAGQNLVADINAINRSGVSSLLNKGLQTATGTSGPVIAYLLWKKLKEDHSDRSDYSGNQGSV